MISDFDIWRSAKILVDKHGEDARLLVRYISCPPRALQIIKGQKTAKRVLEMTVAGDHHRFTA